MSFLIVLICCVIELTYMSFAPLRKSNWIVDWHRWLESKLGLERFIGATAVLISIALPVAVLAYLFASWWIDSHLLTLLGGVTVLMFCFGPEDTGYDVEQYIQAYRDPTDKYSSSNGNNFLNAIIAPPSDPDVPFLRAVAIAANERVFAPAFWFIVLGPLGALCFRMASALARNLSPGDSQREVADRLHQILLWLPLRLLAVALGLAGTLGPVLKLLSERTYGLAEGTTLIGDAAVAALGDNRASGSNDDEHVILINSMFALVKRAFVVWLAVLALCAAAGIV
ncbi:MAG: regulatory signaling modulator protein AmpE [Proteobacteria bacterium]|nr:regulatory signaling modulator protein AmpE [Pseudomonadota bacterium]